MTAPIASRVAGRSTASSAAATSKPVKPSGTPTGKSKKPGVASSAASMDPGKVVEALKPESMGASKLVVAEFFVCFLVIIAAPLDKQKHGDVPANTLIKRMSALAFLFIILGLISTGGKGAARVAASVGGLVTLTLLLTERNLFTVLAKVINTRATTVEGTAPSSEEVNA